MCSAVGSWDLEWVVTPLRCASWLWNLCLNKTHMPNESFLFCKSQQGVAFFFFRLLNVLVHSAIKIAWISWHQIHLSWTSGLLICPPLLCHQDKVNSCFCISGLKVVIWWTVVISLNWCLWKAFNHRACCNSRWRMSTKAVSVPSWSPWACQDHRTFQQ